jgi:UDPglucose 6-dehydrogenase
MRIGVAGLWHLGCVTAACLAKSGFDVVGYDPDINVVAKLQEGIAPIFEPGLTELLADGVNNRNLLFTSESRALSASEVVWVNFDTPVDNADAADVDSVIRAVEIILPDLQPHTLIIMSSQVPVGTTQKLIQYCESHCPDKKITFAYIPENLRLGKAIEVFTQPERIVVGLDNPDYKSTIENLLKPFSNKLIWMSIVSAEMTKHAINSFLALSVTFINELASLCETVGANASQVEAGLKSEGRIGPKAYLKPGDAIAGGTLMRDINYLRQLGEANNRDTHLFSAVVESNHYHKKWVCRKLADLLQGFAGKKIAMLGLTYKADTDTLRRSMAVETCEWLYQQGVNVHAYDPAINILPPDISQFIHIQSSVKDAISSADAVVISTSWPDFREITPDDFLTHLKSPYVLDASGYISQKISADKRISYFSVGVAS